MAIVYSKRSQGDLLEVRTAGRTVRLYVNGVLHTQYNPTQSLTGDVWDPMGLTPLFAPENSIQSTLMMGLGGGAVIHLLRRHFQIPNITAVELDLRKIKVAKRFFGLRSQQVKLVHQDASVFIKRARKPRYDYIIDDLFGEQDGIPVRAFKLNQAWCDALLKRLKPHGWLAVNCADRKEAESSALLNQVKYRERFPCAFGFKIPVSDNFILILCGELSSKKSFRSNLNSHPNFQDQQARKRIRFRITQIW